MQGYRHGPRGSILEYAVKKYASQRAIPAIVLRTIEADFEQADRRLKQKSLKSNSYNSSNNLSVNSLFYVPRRFEIEV